MDGRRLFHFWMTHSMKYVTVPLGVATVVGEFLSNVSSDPTFGRIGLVIGVIGLFHFLIHTYFYRRHRFLSNAAMVSTMPKKRIKSVGMRYMALYLLLTAVVLVLVFSAYQGTLLALMRGVLLLVFGTLLRGLVSTSGLGGSDTVVGNAAGADRAAGSLAGAQEGAWGQGVSALQTVLVVVGLVVIVVLIALLIVAKIRQKVYEAASAADGVTIYDTNDKSEQSKVKGSWRDALDFSDTMRVRRMYKKLILQKKPRAVALASCFTPKELEAAVHIDPELGKSVHELYEKARYSKEGCSEEDVAVARESLKVARG